MTNISLLAGPSEDLKAFRSRLGLNQLTLAKLLDVSQATVSRWERGLLAVDPCNQRALRNIEASHGQNRPSAGLFAGLDLGEHWSWLLRFFRVYQNMSQEHLACVMECSPETISRWECGRYVPDLRAQLKLRDLILAPLDSDSMLKQIRTRMEASSGLYNANWGNLCVAISQGMELKRAGQGYPSPRMARVDHMHDGLYEDWNAKLWQAGLFRGEVLLSYGFITVSGNDSRVLISLPLKLESGGILDVVTHLPHDYPPEYEGQINIVPCDTSVG